MTCNKNIAFTLAEVLITLGIIGVVAAMTIPGLITKYRRHVVETKLAKFDSVINQAVRMSIAENDDLVYNGSLSMSQNEAGEYLKEWLNENLLQYMNTSYDGDVITSESGNNYYKVNFLDGTGFVTYLQLASSSTVINFFYCLDAADDSCEPESYDGRNTFVFQYNTDEKAILPYGSSVSNLDKLKNNTSSGARGCYSTASEKRHYCARLIQLNGWKIPDDYPWIK